VLEYFSKIETFVFDVDGVLTDGSLLVMPDGEMVRRMNIKDGYALQLAIKQGYKVCIISGGKSQPVKERLEKLGVKDVFMGVLDKKQTLYQYLASTGGQPETTLFMGDDIPDLEAMTTCLLPCCPSDACQEVKSISKYISPIAGGFGAGRDVIEKVMKLQDKWQHIESASSR
jgi:3-deoxy-D-manno-octulosonate 8-phosphate phosphatase (KDO 8-P phosphatase)